MARGFGVAGALDHEIVKRIAPAAERAGFSTFWANDTPTGDGLESLAIAASVTESIRLGVGVIPIDRKPAREIIEEVRRLELPENRLTVGIGSGGLFKGSIKAVLEAAIELEDVLRTRILVGSLGPKMTALGGFNANGSLLNWLTPEYAAKSAKLVRDAASSAGRPETHIAAYVRVALGREALSALKTESDRYGGYPQYARNFSRMGVSAFDTTVYGESAEALQPKLAEFERQVDEVVIRAIVANDQSSDYLELLQATSPDAT
jgi:alkanesulfonate monooxygenase SsuD/methylene tetrahydromethanopterin reductase-like flavin-dependent oxidoreductase (luciferase family)